MLYIRYSRTYLPCRGRIDCLFKLPRIKPFILLFTVLILSIVMASSSGLFSRIFRPFSSGAMHLNPEGAAQAVPEGAAKCTVAAGCFWGVEHMYRHAFKGKGLYDARVGYIGGDTSNPSYRAVCSGRTGHAEALQVVYDPSQITYRQLLEFFYKMHDPTTMNSQGPDRGSQYRSGIFYHDEEQEKVARDVTDRVQKEWWKSGKVVTEILPAGQWWDAEAYHQKYLDNNPGGYECPSQYVLTSFSQCTSKLTHPQFPSQVPSLVPVGQRRLPPDCASFSLNSLYDSPYITS